MAYSFWAAWCYVCSCVDAFIRWGSDLPLRLEAAKEDFAYRKTLRDTEKALRVIEMHGRRWGVATRFGNYDGVVLNVADVIGAYYDGVYSLSGPHTDVRHPSHACLRSIKAWPHENGLE